MTTGSPNTATLRTISARRVALLPALLCLTVSPLFISTILGNPVQAQKYFLLFAIVTSWAIYLPLRILRERKGMGPRTGLDAWVGAVAFTTLLSVVLSPDRALSLLAAFAPLAMLSFYFLLSDVLISVRADGRIVGALLISTALVATIGVLEYLGIELLPYVRERSNVKQVVLATLGHPNFVASYLGPVIFLSPIALLSLKKTKGRSFLRVSIGVIVLLLLVCLLMTGARGMWLALIAAASVLAATYVATQGRLPLAIGSARIPWKVPAAIAVGLTLVVGLLVIPNPLLKSRFNLAKRITSTQEIRTRYFYWFVAEEMIARKPVLGIGYRRFSTSFWNEVVEMQKKPENAFFKDYLIRIRGKMPGEAHNEFLEIAAEQGLVGLAAFLGMLVWFGVSGCALAASGAVPRAVRVRLVYLMSAILVMLGDSMFGFPLQLPASGLLFWAVMAMLRSEIVAARAAVAQ